MDRDDCLYSGRQERPSGQLEQSGEQNDGQTRDMAPRLQRLGNTSQTLTERMEPSHVTTLGGISFWRES
jgi:hypothetical protein